MTMKPHRPRQIAQYWLENSAFRFCPTETFWVFAASITTRSSILKKQTSNRISAITAKMIETMIQLRCVPPNASTNGIVDTVTTILPIGPQKMRIACVEVRDFWSRVISEAIVEYGRLSAV